MKADTLTQSVWRTQMLTQAELKRQLHYNPETGIFTRLVSNTTWVKIGDITGSKTSDGYFCICVNKKVYRSHRLAWLYIYGSFPKTLIDHINMDRLDNRISNLREATYQQNSMNSKIQKSNKSGFKGVSFNKKLKKWVAASKLNGKQNYLGLFITPELAHEAYQEFVSEHHGEFARL